MTRAAGAFFTFALIFGTSCGPASAQAQSDSPPLLVPHRAIYDLTLQQTRGNSSIAAVRGRILYDFSGSACDGYSLTFRQVSEIDSSEGKQSTSDLRSTTWEGADARRFKFTSQNFVDGNLVNAVDGHADHDGKITAVDLHKPDHRTVDLGGRLVFPTEHMVRAIEAARARKTILSFPIYDGSENGEKVFNTLTVIGKQIAPGARQYDDAAAHEPKLADVPRWPVTISYFAKGKAGDTGEQTPDYAIGFELYDNGISRALTLDYNDFIVSGKLVSLDIKTPKPCK
jgi:envelope integrity protein B